MHARASKRKGAFAGPRTYLFFFVVFLFVDSSNIVYESGPLEPLLASLGGISIFISVFLFFFILWGMHGLYFVQALAFQL